LSILRVFEDNNGFLMGFPDIPLEVNKDLRLYSLMFVHGDGLDVNGSVKVLDFVVVSVEAVVIFLGVELNDGGF
jgi:hypothetical protein